MKFLIYLKYYLHKIVQKTLGLFNLRLTNNSRFEANLKKAKSYYLVNFLKICENKNLEKLIDIYPNTKSQWLQDLFVLECLNFKEKGFFVEFGACDGIKLSNSYVLEKYFNWNGILSEPAKGFHNSLKKNRKCFLNYDCVSNETNKKLEFRETKYRELSTTKDNAFNDKYRLQRLFGKSYFVQTISLNDLLLKYNCPSRFEYLSIDTEGSEYEILENLDFNKFLPKIITVEHNYINKKRDKIYELLSRNGYKRVFKEISYCDDWYINNN